MSERTPTGGCSPTRQTLPELYDVHAPVHVHVVDLAEHAEPPLGPGAAGDREGRGAIPRPAGDVTGIELDLPSQPVPARAVPHGDGGPCTAHPLGMIANLVSLLETGVPVRFLRLGIAFIEAGTSLAFHVPTGRCVAFEDICPRSYDVRVCDQGEIAVVI